MQSALALLQPTISYAQKRADADRNMMLQAQMTLGSQQDVETARQQNLLLQQQQQQLLSVPFLEKDQERWHGMIDGLKKKIRQRVENDFGGDHEAYARTMLEQDMQNLALDAQRSPLYSAALERRSNVLRAQKDAEEGKIYRPVQYKLANGQTKVAPWEQAYQDFNNGDTEELPYGGGFKVSGKWREHFDKVYSPRVDKLGKFRPDQATKQEFMASLVANEGLTGADAEEYARRTEGMIAPIFYKFDAVNPFEVERTKQGWANIALGRERNAIARDRNQIAKKASAGQIDRFDETFNNPDNIITRNADRSPGTLNATLFNPDMQTAGSVKLQGFSGKGVGREFLESTGAVYDKKLGTHIGAGGQAFVKVKNDAGGVDLRATDLSGLHYTTQPSHTYRYETQPTEYERAAGRKPYKYLQEQIITISSDEAKKAKAGKLFRGAIPLRSDEASGYNTDTETGKGAYTTIERDKKTYYQFRVMQPVEPTQLDRSEASFQHMNTQGKVGQAVINDADDDLNYY